MNFIYFTTIKKQVYNLYQISLVGTDVRARVSLKWEETGVPRENPCGRTGDNLAIPRTTLGWNPGRIGATNIALIIALPDQILELGLYLYYTFYSYFVNFITLSS